MEKFFTHISVDPLVLTLPEKAIFSRLGRNRFLNKIDPAMEVRVRLAMLKAFECCKAKGRWKLLTVTDRSSEYVQFNGHWQINSRKFSEFVNQSPFVWLGAVTIGNRLNELIRSTTDSMTDCAVYDAVGSECADLAIGLLQKIAAQELLRNGFTVDLKRFSAGYGGVELTHQQEIFRQLKLEDLQMSLNESCIMQPEKSVTAFCTINR